METTKRALRGVKRVRWWRKHGLSVVITIMCMLIICAMWNTVKIAANASIRRDTATLPASTTKVKEMPTSTLETVDDLPEETNSTEYNIQEYMQEEIKISSVNYYAASDNSTAYYVDVVVNSEPQPQEQVYTYLGRTYYEQDVQNIARIAWFEQGVCGKEMTQLAAAVLINRSHWSAFASTYLDAFYQDNQYSTYTIDRYESSEEIPEEVYDWIVELLNGESAYGIVPETVVYQAQFPQGIDTYATSANTYICYADESRLGEYIP